MQTIEFFYDFTSPYSFLAMTQLQALAARADAILEARPFVLGAVFKAAGNTPPAALQAKAAYMAQDLQAWASTYGVKFSLPDIFPINAIKPERLVVATSSREDAWKLTDRLFRAFWSDGLDIRESDVLAKIATEAGFDAAALLARTETQEVKDRLRANTDDAIARGAFGAPTIFVGDQMFVGNDRLPFVERAARGERVYR